jgi:hypothetical protein
MFTRCRTTSGYTFPVGMRVLLLISLMGILLVVFRV